MRALFTLAFVISIAAGVAAAEPPRLSLPVRCDAGRCLVQSYVDIDPGPGVRDFACGSATYDGHKGTDFRLQSAAEVQQGFPVLVAADGTVKGLRDGMADAFVSAQTRSSVAGRECGNGVVIDHGGGWETQYCHLRQGSITVKPGEAVRRGQRLGDVGYSGLTEFAHLHLEVRRNGEAVDPFTGGKVGDACALEAALQIDSGLWDASARVALPYANGDVVSVAFSDAVPLVSALEVDHRLPTIKAVSAQLIFAARILNLRAGDIIVLEASGPGGFSVSHRSDPLPRAQASYVAYAGRRLTSAAWAAGLYTGKARLERDGAVVSERTSTMTLDGE